MTALNGIGQRLAGDLIQAQYIDDERNRALAHAEKINIVGAGATLTAAYEQLRNAAENTEEHLLLQSAIRRFYRQLFITRDEQLVISSGTELAIELTHAGYTPNDSLTRQQVDLISLLATEYYQLYEKLLKRRSISPDTSINWVLDALSVRAEAVINDHGRDAVFVNFSYEYLQTIIPAENVAGKDNHKDEYGAALYVAIHKSLLKSNTAIIRAGLLARYDIAADDTDRFISYNQRVDELLIAPFTDRLYRIVDRQGAPLRILRRMIDEDPAFVSQLPRREVFLEKFEQQVNHEYARVRRRINRAVTRSIVFLIITKLIIGIAIEVPYDIWAHGQVIWLPLLVNLAFPPCYMFILSLTNTMPGYANTTALIDRVDAMLYGEKTVLVRKRLSTRSYGAFFSFFYAIFSIGIFGAVLWGLLMLNFSLVHIAIFFVFMSTASFLGFRISRMIRELELVRSSANGLTFIRDVIYLPFVVVGRWMSEKYSQVNIVTTILDMLIELPLKTVLRLVRQWGAFIDERKDRI